MHRHRIGGDDADVATVELVAVAVGAVENTHPPSFRQAFNVRQRIRDTERQQEAPPLMYTTFVRPDGEAIPRARCRNGRILDPRQRGVTLELRPRDPCDLRRVAPVLAQETV
ncbi:hypothetical protein D3C71_1808810 [compost metagenome]